MNPSRRRLTLPIALTIAVLAVSTASILIRFAQREASSLAIAALRLVLASLALAPVAVARHRAEIKAIPRRDLALAVLSGLFLAVHFGTWISSLAYTSVASSVVLVSTGPIWVALLSPIFLGERLSRPAVLGLILAILGGLVISGADACTWDRGISCAGLAQVLHGPAMWGNFLALVGAWAVSGYLIIGRRLRQGIALVPYVFVVYSLAGVALLITVYTSGGTVLGLSPTTYLWIALLALVPQLIGHSTYNWALKALPAALVAVMTLGEPIGSAILAYFLLQETPGPAVLVGGVVILGGIYLAARGAQLDEPAADAPAALGSTDVRLPL
jgi:drug/metabolite transporter (DMT)-like permease